MRGGGEADPECGLVPGLALVPTGLHGALLPPLQIGEAETHTARPASGAFASIGLLEVSLPSGLGGVTPRLARPCPERPGSCPSLSLELGCWAVRGPGHSAREGSLGAAGVRQAVVGEAGREGPAPARCPPGGLRGTGPLLC